MKTTVKFLTYLMMIFTLVITSTSCDGEDGANGIDGVEGPQGPAGQDGNANVIASPWFQSSSWVNSGSPSAYFDRSAPEVTQEIIDNGVVIAYTKLAGDSNYTRPLPATTLDRFFWNFFITEPENIRFTAFTLDGSNISPSSNNQFRYVIIPSSELLNRSSIDLNDYNAVKEFYKLKD
ncbi:hypothetical protein [Aquimarina sp. MMG016]|uniref:hypothetical protein n=1 Tax=Aquimarina sp. MMG016 TaxID=2822690 RepID=UPI001B3A04C5|nr:hypothetical protein [Aquimarina sp. MMG016]MBQ4820170.1 hypothetical protein [Aquimarina sp. MMG016]